MTRPTQSEPTMTNWGVRGCAAGVEVPETLRVLVADILRGGGGAAGGAAGGTACGTVGSGWALGSGWVTEQFLAGGYSHLRGVWQSGVWNAWDGA